MKSPVRAATPLLSSPTGWLLAAALGTASTCGACGSRSELSIPGSQGNGSGGSAGGAGSGGDEPCAPVGAGCATEQDCCNAACTGGVCTRLPRPCETDEGPMLLASELSDPYSLGGDATSLFVGQLEEDRPILRARKAPGGAP